MHPFLLHLGFDLCMLEKWSFVLLSFCWSHSTWKACVDMWFFALGIGISFVDGWDWNYWGYHILHLWGSEIVTHTTTALQGASYVAHSWCSFGFSFKVGRALYKNIAVSHCISVVINRKLVSAPEGISVGFHVSMIFSDGQHLNMENILEHRQWKSFS